MPISRPVLKRCIGEFTGSAIILFVGCMGCTVVGVGVGSAFMEAVSFGWAYMIALHVAIGLSGGHLNPAVTIACYVRGQIERKMAYIYCGTQLIGGIFGYVVLLLAIPSSLRGGWANDAFGATLINDSIDMWQGFLLEFVLTAIVVYFYCSAWDEHNMEPPDTLPVRFGFLMVGLLLSGGHYTGGSANLARSLPPTLFHGLFRHIWLYAFSHVLAGIVVPLAWKYLHNRGKALWRPDAPRRSVFWTKKRPKRRSKRPSRQSTSRRSTIR